MAKQLVLVGGGHAHLEIIKNLNLITGRGHRVTLVSPTPFQDYSGMGPGLLSGRFRLAEARFNIARMTTIRGGKFIEAAACGLDPANRTLRLDDGQELSYDVLSLNCGSAVGLPAPKTALGTSIFPVKPISNLFHARQKIIAASRQKSERLRLLIIGGGPAGCEVTGNLQEMVRSENISADIVLVAGSRLLSTFPEAVRNKTRELLAREELQLLEGVHVSRLQSRRAELDDGRTIDFDIAFVASGIEPNLPFEQSDWCSANGLKVNRFLQSPFYPELFGGGDCIDFQPRPLDRVGVYAVRQGPVLRQNLLACLGKKPLTEFSPQKSYLLIFNLGLGRAVATGYGLHWSGRSARLFKTFLDRSFMKKYQEIG
ncbi:MAG: pyridine nucleotide-disulfide oxidoreductase [Desulfuromonas sp.]|nr:MAG: pyridine nucleotide-disulfide oxidoreductase [Desulfuromonas sp.]